MPSAPRDGLAHVQDAAERNGSREHSAPLLARPFRDLFGTLRFRLTLWNTAVVFVFVIGTLWGVREGLRFVLWKEADDQLLEDAGEVKETIEQLWPNEEKIRDELNRKATTHTHRGLHMRIFDRQGKELFVSTNAPAN